MKESRYNIHEKCRNIGHNYGAPLCSSKHHDKKRNLKVDLNKCKCIGPHSYICLGQIFSSIARYCGYRDSPTHNTLFWV